MEAGGKMLTPPIKEIIMQSMKRNLSLFLTVCLILSVIPFTVIPVRAADSYNVWVGATEVTSSAMSGSGWKFTPAAETTDKINTLEITDLKVAPSQMGNLFSVGFFDMRCGIYSKNSLKIICNGNSKITGQFDTDTSLAAGIYVESGRLTIGGTGTLEIDVKKAYRANLTGSNPAIRTVGMYSAKAMTLEDSVSVSITTENSPGSIDSDTFGVHVGSGGSGRFTLTESASLHVVTDASDSGNTYAINANCIVDGIGTNLQLTSGAVTGNGNSDVCTGTLTVNSGTAELQSGKNPIQINAGAYEEPTVYAGTVAADAQLLTAGNGEISGYTYIRIYRQWPAPEFSTVTEGVQKVTCQDSVTLTALAAGDVKYEWQVFAGAGMGYVPISQMVSLSDAWAAAFSGYDTPSLTVDSDILVEGENYFLCKVTANWRDPSLKVSATSPKITVEVVHDWTFSPKTADKHTKTCAGCSEYHDEEHTFKYTVLDTTTAGTKYQSECVYCGYTETSSGYVSVDKSDELLVTFHFNGGICSSVGASNTSAWVTIPRYEQSVPSVLRPIPISGMSREGYRFLGWAHRKDAVVPDYWADEEIFYAEDTTLYAVWGDVYYGYSTLNDIQKNVYNLLHEALQSSVPSQNFSIPREWKVPVDDLLMIAEIYMADHPDCFWFKGIYTYSYYSVGGVQYANGMTPQFELDGNNLSKSELSEAKHLFRLAAGDVLTEMSRAGVTSEYEMALWLHDKVAELVVYDGAGVTEGGTGLNHQTAYGALVDGKAVCAGYARLYQYLLQCAGIPAWTLRGDSVNPVTGQSVPHAWNLMWLNDGQDCLYADVTWDDQGEYLFHLYFARDYYAFSGNGVNSGHVPDAEYFAAKLPVCDADCTEQHIYGTENIIAGTVTAAAVAERLVLQEDGQTFIGKFYDPDDKIAAWIAGAENLQALMQALGLNGCSVSYISVGGSTAGIELQVMLKSNTPVTPPETPPVTPPAENVTVNCISTISYTVSGSVVTVDHEAACKVGYLDSGEYKAVAAAANGDGTYSFTVPTGVTEVLLVVKGDVNGDGKSNSSDYGRLNAAILEKISLTQEASFAADVNGDGKANSSDYGRMNAVILEKTSLTW